jgi:hypothetical protein
MFDSLLKWFVDGTSVQVLISAVYCFLILEMEINCGSEPARESGGSVDINVECQSVFASKLAPTGFAWIS